MRLTYLLGLGLAAASLPQIAAAQSARLDPGLYDLDVEVIFAGRPFGGDQTEVCIKAGENDDTIENLITGANKDLDCPHTNVVWTDSTLTADYTCEPDKSGIVISGSVKADYGPDYLNFVMDGILSETMKIGTDFKMRRKGDCPEGWVDPKPFG